MLSIAIQAGGQSSRMGEDKALVSLAGKPIIEHVIERVEGLGDEIFITTNHPDDFAYLGIRLIGDQHPGAGALEGLNTALGAALGKHTLVLACDLPFLNRSLLHYMIDIRFQADVVVPRHRGKYEPLHAIYSRACYPPVQACLKDGKRRVLCFYSQVKVHTIEERDLTRFDPMLLSFFNINTPEDLTQAEEWIKSLD